MFGVLLWGSYTKHWSWAGINGHTAKLWDWLHLLLLPFVLAFLPIWLSRTTRVSARRKRLGLTAIGVFAVVVLLGYTIPWVWTGFRGNTLWDWFGLIALPVAVALAPVVDELRRKWNHRHTLIALAGCCAFAVVVLGGYLAGWKWTGFPQQHGLGLAAVAAPAAPDPDRRRPGAEAAGDDGGHRAPRG